MTVKWMPEEKVPVPDEGWWASVLAEDQGYLNVTKTVPKEEAPKKNTLTDWERALRLYQQDEILLLEVVAYNRGGLLVEGECLNGFVPCSHLVDFSPALNEEQREDCFAAYIGRKLKLKIIECVPSEGRIVFSERAARA